MIKFNVTQKTKLLIFARPPLPPKRNLPNIETPSGFKPPNHPNLNIVQILKSVEKIGRSLIVPYKVWASTKRNWHVFSGSFKISDWQSDIVHNWSTDETLCTEQVFLFVSGWRNLFRNCYRFTVMQLRRQLIVWIYDYTRYRTIHKW